MRYDITVFGVKDTTGEIISYIESFGYEVSLIVTIHQDVLRRNDVSGFADMSAIAEQRNIPLYQTKDYSMNDVETEKFFATNDFGLGISMGWQRLIPQSILRRFSSGVFGFHGSCAYLPFGRGRSPLNWSLILGDSRFILNMFQYDEQADSPNVFKNVMFEINPFDTIRTLQYKNIIASKRMIRELLGSYREGNISINRNSKDIDSWYRKRSPDDGEIDFRNRTRDIYNLIRAVTRPFPGAFAFCKGQRVTIWDAVPFDQILDFSDYCPGQIIGKFDGKPIIRTVDGSLLVRDYECDIELQELDILRGKATSDSDF